uniref:Uncharacterized protein n=1 Tax=Siphoviridae sp. ctMOb8 TaxID=2825460 RepID=A0A8S5Q133_9CAUD|nr:MAG TPA: hypothetical protein [Siphoviridae sp. ctMOb8]
MSLCDICSGLGIFFCFMFVYFVLMVQRYIFISNKPNY